eukprot:763504-Hanusia_phi.AAC.5
MRLARRCDRMRDSVVELKMVKKLRAHLLDLCRSGERIVCFSWTPASVSSALSHCPLATRCHLKSNEGEEGRRERKERRNVEGGEGSKEVHKGKTRGGSHTERCQGGGGQEPQSACWASPVITGLAGPSSRTRESSSEARPPQRRAPRRGGARVTDHPMRRRGSQARTVLTQADHMIGCSGAARLS